MARSNLRSNPSIWEENKNLIKILVEIYFY